jgi:hypothetical protein
MYSPPLLPLVESPVLSTINPLTPDDPALPVRNSNNPLDVTVLFPLMMETRPPELDEVEDAPELSPPMITISPPVPLLPAPTVIYNAPPRPLKAVPEPI